MYVVKTFDKTEFVVSEQEAMILAEKMNSGTEKVVVLQGNIIAISSISAILKEEKAREQEEKKDHAVGVLHDGTRVVKQFGEWYCMSGVPDENGRYQVKPDPQHYPEIYRDDVPSVKEHDRAFDLKYDEQIKQLELKKQTLIGEDPTLNNPYWCAVHQVVMDCALEGCTVIENQILTMRK